MPIDRSTSVMENRLASQRDLNSPMACERCGSTYFEEVKLYQYASRSYGSNDYTLLTNQAKNILKCPCGYIVLPQAKHVAGSSAIRGAAEAFTISTQSAKNLLDRLSPEQFAKAAATPKELDTVKEEILQIITTLKQSIEKNLEDFKASIPAPTKPVKTKEPKTDAARKED